MFIELGKFYIILELKLGIRRKLGWPFYTWKRDLMAGCLSGVWGNSELCVGTSMRR